jgi:hypothetical protein
MMVYAKSLLVALCATGVVIGWCWSAGLVPWYFATMAGLAVVMAGGWQLRRPWRDRR